LKLKIKNLIYKNKTQIRYIFSGISFTIAGPGLFVLLALYIPPMIAIIIADTLIHTLRFSIITRWVFRSRINKNSIYAYLKATIPISISNFILVSLLVPLFGSFIVALLVVIFSSTIGFIWNKFCYQKTNRS
tara:strand:+ start:75 stop:470 length:396 start_codon:yes stop_codon:yes gene_type:complete